MINWFYKDFHPNFPIPNLSINSKKKSSKSSLGSFLEPNIQKLKATCSETNLKPLLARFQFDWDDNYQFKTTTITINYQLQPPLFKSSNYEI